MTGKKITTICTGTLLGDDAWLTLAEVCRASGVAAEFIEDLVADGIIEPEGRSRSDWRFRPRVLRRVITTVRLERDLGLNTPGAALALDLLDEIERLRARLRIVETACGD
jgi:chaperone modulatory protein CbpM